MIDQTEGSDRGGDLFSRQASDNAEVVPPGAPRTHDELWSTEADEPDLRGGAGTPTGPPPTPPEPPPMPSADVFSSEPVQRNGDVVDEAIDEPAPWRFGVGSEHTGSSLWRDLTPPDAGRGAAPDWSVLHDDPRDDVPDASPWSGEGAPTRSGVVEPADDPNGFEAAVRRLDPGARQLAVVPLVVAGALLLPGERVTDVVVGSMLGAPAVVVATAARVLVVNDRRWQPVVDVYRIDRRLTVRGRSDRGVAALSLADEDRLSMVDGITDVDAAVAMADRIRSAAASH